MGISAIPIRATETGPTRAGFFVGGWYRQLRHGRENRIPWARAGGSIPAIPPSRHPATASRLFAKNFPHGGLMQSSLKSEGKLISLIPARDTLCFRAGR